jgi:hypothetical protein
MPICWGRVCLFALSYSFIRPSWKVSDSGQFRWQLCSERRRTARVRCGVIV